MREYKFRLWSPKAGRMVNAPLDSYSVKGTIIPQITLPGLEDCILSQWIGKDDVNGQGIYEGDIVADHLGNKYEVVFTEHLGGMGFFARSLGEVSYLWTGTILWDHLEVIDHVFREEKEEDPAQDRILSWLK